MLSFADRSLVNDAQCRALSVNQNGKIQRQLTVNGEVLGRYGVGPNEAGNMGQLADFNFGYQKITGRFPSAGVGSYMVRAGDTLRSIARASYGDEKLWWQIADATDLAGESGLRVRQTLTIPSVVGGVHNNTGTFKPYDPSKITGDTTPPKKASFWKKLAVIVVEAVVSYFTAGALGSVWYANIVAAVAGSVANQLTAMALDMQGQFSWKQVGEAALTAGIAPGMTPDVGATNGLMHAVTRAAISNAVNQGRSVVVGLQDKFSWKGVAAAAIGGGDEPCGLRLPHGFARTQRRRHGEGRHRWPSRQKRHHRLGQRLRQPDGFAHRHTLRRQLPLGHSLGRDGRRSTWWQGVVQQRGDGCVWQCVG